MKEALLSHEEPCQEVVERLGAILLELERLPLPASKVGAALLDTLESADRVRRALRAQAKAKMTTGPPGSVPAARASNAGGQGDELRATQPVVVRVRRKCKRECADAMRLACVCLSYEELAEFLVKEGLL